MAGKTRHLLERAGRYYARIVVPERLRSIVNKAELSVALGADRREALRKLPAAVARFQQQIADAEERCKSPAESTRAAVAFDAVRAARALYDSALAFDSELRNLTPLYALSGDPDENYIGQFEDIIAGRLDDDQMPVIFLSRLHLHIPPDLDRATWRRATRILAQAELAGLEVTIRRNDGKPDPAVPAFLEVKNSPVEPPPLLIREVFNQYRKELQRIGKGRDAEGRWAPVVDSLLDFMGHDSAPRRDWLSGIVI